MWEIITENRVSRRGIIQLTKEKASIEIKRFCIEYGLNTYTDGINFFGHMTRVDTNQLAQQAYNTRVSGYKARGHPQKDLDQGRQRQPEGTQHPPRHTFKTCV